MFLVNNNKLSDVTGIGDQVEKRGIVEVKNGYSDDPLSIFLCPSGCGCTRYFSCGCGPGPLKGGRERELIAREVMIKQLRENKIPIVPHFD